MQKLIQKLSNAMVATLLCSSTASQMLKMQFRTLGAEIMLACVAVLGWRVLSAAAVYSFQCTLTNCSKT